MSLTCSLLFAAAPLHGPCARGEGAHRLPALDTAACVCSGPSSHKPIHPSTQIKYVEGGERAVTRFEEGVSGYETRFGSTLDSRHLHLFTRSHSLRFKCTGPSVVSEFFPRRRCAASPRQTARPVTDTRSVCHCARSTRSPMVRRHAVDRRRRLHPKPPNATLTVPPDRSLRRPGLCPDAAALLADRRVLPHDASASVG